MSYVDEDETSAVFSDMSGILRDYQPRPIPKTLIKVSTLHYVLSGRIC